MTWGRQCERSGQEDNTGHTQECSDNTLSEKQESNTTHMSGNSSQRLSDLTLTEKQEASTTHMSCNKPQRLSDLTLTEKQECSKDCTNCGKLHRPRDITLTEEPERNMERGSDGNALRPRGTTPTRFPSIVALKYRYHDPPQQEVLSDDTLATHNKVEGAGASPCSTIKASTDKISEDDTEEGTCPVPHQEDSEDGEEEVVSLPLEEKRSDPLWRERIYNNIEGVEHSGMVIDIERGTKSHERLYLIRYQDGELQHMTARQVLALEAERQQAMRRAKSTKRPGGG